MNALLLKEGRSIVSRFEAGLIRRVLRPASFLDGQDFPLKLSSMSQRKDNEPVSLAQRRTDRGRTESDLEAELTVAAWAPGRRRYERFKALLAERAARRSA
jgi:hypothetical protein